MGLGLDLLLRNDENEAPLRQLERPKACPCGLSHPVVLSPSIHVKRGDLLDGIYFNCPCGSTLWIPEYKLESK